MNLGFHIHGLTEEEEKYVLSSDDIPSRTMEEVEKECIINHPAMFIYFSHWRGKYDDDRNIVDWGDLGRASAKSAPQRPKGDPFRKEVNILDNESIKIEWEGKYGKIFIKKQTNIPYLTIKKFIKLCYYIDGCRSYVNDVTDPNKTQYQIGIVATSDADIENLINLRKIKDNFLDITTKSYELENPPNYVTERCYDVIGAKRFEDLSRTRKKHNYGEFGFCYRDHIILSDIGCFITLSNNSKFVGKSRRKIECRLVRSIRGARKDEEEYEEYGDWGLWEQFDVTNESS